VARSLNLHFQVVHEPTERIESDDPWRVGDKVRECVDVVEIAMTIAVVHVILQATIGFSLLGRSAIAFGLVFPCAILLGFAFPSGLLRFGDQAKAWFWAINGAFGVLASVLSLALAMMFGFKAVLALGITAYVLAALLLKSSKASDPVAGS